RPEVHPKTLGAATRRATYSNQYRLSITFFLIDNLFLKQPTFGKNKPKTKQPFKRDETSIIHNLSMSNGKMTPLKKPLP
ncbi:MAG: hypothetical protein WCK54_17485, partial [Desulfuromonadales bacterium]